MKRIAIEVVSGALLLAGMVLILSWDQLIDRRSRARRARAELAARRKAWPSVGADRVLSATRRLTVYPQITADCAEMTDAG